MFVLYCVYVSDVRLAQSNKTNGIDNQSSLRIPSSLHLIYFTFTAISLTRFNSSHPFDCASRHFTLFRFSLPQSLFPPFRWKVGDLELLRQPERTVGVNVLVKSNWMMNRMRTRKWQVGQRSHDVFLGAMSESYEEMIKQ